VLRQDSERGPCRLDYDILSAELNSTQLK
jgi:hypothetical protein